MKKLIFTLAIMATAAVAYSHDLMFDDFLKDHEKVGPKLSTIVCEIEDLTHEALTIDNLDEQNRLGEQIRRKANELKSEIGTLRSKNKVEGDNVYGTILFASTGNPYFLFFGGDELPKSKYYSYIEEMAHLGWRLAIAKDGEKIDKKGNELLEMISKYNIYHAEVEVEK